MAAGHPAYHEPGPISKALADNAVPLRREGQPLQLLVVCVSVQLDGQHDVLNAYRDRAVHPEGAPGVEGALGL